MSVEEPTSPHRARSPLPALPESFLPREHALYRPRHADRQRTALVTAAVFFCVPLLLLVLGVRPGEFENRKLAEFPSPADGWGFFTGLNQWANDHLPLREQAVAAQDGISRGLFGEAPKFERPQGGVGPVQPPEDPSLDRPEPTAYVDVIEGKGNWLYLGHDIKDACRPALPTDEVFTRLARLRAAVEASGRRFVLVVAPNKTTMVPEYLPARYFGQECFTKARDNFWNNVVARTGALDLRPALRESAQRVGRPVYTEKDTHWTNEGGLVMARAITNAVKPGTSASWKVEQAGQVERASDLPPLLGRSDREMVQSYDISPDGKNVRSREVPGDPRQPQRVTQPPAPGVVNAKVGLLGDSFSFYVVRYLVAGFTDITLQHVDAVTTDPHQVGRMLADNDVVVLEAAERNLVGGINSILNPQVIDAIAEELAKRPR
ncbi:hypothetical protein JOF41_006202 [Saccharothrix coeruleofusca]|uniref:alginate O-acetyltransferase AlgX-related protein n=1 Tax=Saccharothrix coeruleofusca TaxID=33919 RepID=UPI001AE705F2|nr:hypothetical protein [Saccharothrix coeruleofusca]MBP2340024.1 hypothetical protein [Saccharothrix coeruleofusca]